MKNSRTKENPKQLDFEGELVLDEESILNKKDPEQKRFRRT